MWTEKEIEFLKDNISVISIKEIALELGRTENAVKSKSYRLGISSKDNIGMTLQEFSDIAGVSYHTVLYWLNKLGLPTHKVGKYRFLTTEKFWSWAKEHKSKINWHKIEINSFGSIPLWVRALKKEIKGSNLKRGVWNEFEIQKLKWLLTDESLSQDDINLILNRSSGSVKRKIYDLYLPSPTKRKVKGRYTDEEVDYIVTNHDKGVSAFDIAKKIGRSEIGVKEKIARLEKEKI